MTDEALKLWQDYEDCEAVHTLMGITEDTEKAYRFYEGNQWYGLESGNEEFPVYNVIAPVVKYKTAMVAMNNMQINYSAPFADKKLQDICVSLSKLAMQKWESFKMDTKCWDVVRAAMISGDSYLYFFNGQGDCQVLDRTDVFLGDESITDINAQPFIYIKERRNVNEVIKEAIENGVPKDVANTITQDDNILDNEKNKCTCLVRMELRGKDLYFTRLTKQTIYKKWQVIKGLGCYPLAAYVCSRQRGSFRGTGEVLPIIPNQIEINRNLARRILNAKMTAYSRLVYASDRIVNPRALTEVGTAIEVEGSGVSSIKDAINYLTPSSMSPDAKILSDELLAVTKQLSGANDAALGNIDPSKASGTAIIAMRDQAELPLNEHAAKYRRFIEDIANIWYSLIRVYAKGKITLPDGETVTSAELAQICPIVRIDVLNATPFSKYAREQAIERLFTMGHITFEEYVAALDDESSVPKSKLEHIIKSRGENLTNDYKN